MWRRGTRYIAFVDPTKTAQKGDAAARAPSRENTAGVVPVKLGLMLEREAVANFTRTASDADLEKIERAHRDIVRRAVAKKIDDRLLNDAQTVDWGLHDMMIDAMGNDIVSNIYRVNSLRIRLIRLEHVVLRPEVVVPTMNEHLELIAAIRERDVAKAVAVLSTHIENARQRSMGNFG